MSNIVYLPSSLEPIINRMAHDHVEVVQGIKNTDSRYQKAFEKAKYQVCMEIRELNTGIKETENPKSKKAVNMLGEFSEILFQGKNGFISRNYFDPNADEKMKPLFKEAATLMENRLKGAIVNLAHIWLEATYEADPLRKLPMKRTDTFFKNVGYKARTSDKAVDQEEMRKADLRRLKRDVIVGLICSAVASAFKLSSSRVEEGINNATKEIATNALGSEKTFEALGEKLAPVTEIIYSAIDPTPPIVKLLNRGSILTAIQEELPL